MKILFLDCETSDVTPLMGQIIEVGGIVAELDPTTLQIKAVEQFESLVRHRKTFDDKITRLTGITETELSNAPNLIDAQELWANWLEKNEREIVAICGHSINFDLGFLKSESWFLPERAEIIDSLDLTKILFPNFSAVNLEYLLEKLSLLEFFDEEHQVDSPDDGQAHRALFDTWCSASLLQSLLRYLKNHPFDPRFYQFLDREMLPFGLEFYSQKVELDPLTPTQTAKEKINIDLHGERLASGNSERFNQICVQAGQTEVNQILDLLHSPLAGELKLILGAFYVGMVYKHQRPEEHLKLHVYTNLEKCFVNVTLDLLEKEGEKHHLTANSMCVLSKFENLLWQIKNLSEEVINLGDLMLLLEVYQKLELQKPEANLTEILSTYDFFLMTMEPHWANNRYQYWYKPRDMLGQETVIKTKFGLLLDKVLSLSALKPAKTGLGDLVKQKILEFIEQLQSLGITSSQRYFFRYVNQKFVISIQKIGFSLTSHLENLFLKYPKLEIETYLSPDWLETLVRAAGVERIVADYQPKITYLNDSQKTFEIKNIDNLVDFLQARQLTTVEKQAPVLILTGNNLSLRKVQKVLTENFEANQYLALGESGSLTKVCSKLTRGFVGLVNVRIGDFGFLNFQKNLPKFAEIWLIGQPYIFVQQYWQNLSKQNSHPQLYLQTIQDLNLHAQTGFIYHKTGQVVKYCSL